MSVFADCAPGRGRIILGASRIFTGTGPLRRVVRALRSDGDGATR
jgi:hypothetical protein